MMNNFGTWNREKSVLRISENVFTVLAPKWEIALKFFLLDGFVYLCIVVGGLNVCCLH